jgi:hypothetical protein
MPITLEWLQRAKNRTTSTSEVSAWDSRCGQYRVEVHRSTLKCEQRAKGKRKKRKEKWYPLVKEGERFEFIRPHTDAWVKTRKTAEEVCEKHAAG